MNNLSQLCYIARNITTRLSTKRPTITLSLSLFPTPLSVKCMNHGLTQVISQCWSDPFAHRKLMESKCFLFGESNFFLFWCMTHMQPFVLIMFVYSIVWILDSDWLTEVLRMLIHFQSFVTGLLMALQFCITLQCFSQLLTVALGLFWAGYLISDVCKVEKKCKTSWDKDV